MERINLKKFGFIRTPKNDFSDDGNRFTTYTIEGYEELEVSKLLSDGELYLAGHVTYKLPYDKYEELELPKKMNQLNGITWADVTDEMIAEFAADCKEAVEGVRRIEANYAWPTYADIWSKLIAERDNAKEVAEELKSMLSVDFFLTTGLYTYQMRYILDDLQFIIQISNRTDAELGEQATRYLQTARGVDIANGKYTEYNIEYKKNRFLKYFNELQNKQ